MNSNEIIQQEAYRLTQLFSERVFRGRKAVSLREICGEDFPDILAARATLHARKMYDEIRPLKELEGKRYGQDRVEKKALFQQLRQTIIQETVFTKSELLEIAATSFHFQLDVIARPRRKLLDACAIQGRVPGDAVLIILAGFNDTRPLIKEYITSIRLMDQDVLTRDDMETRCREAEQALFKQTPVSALLADIRTVLAFETAVTGTTQCFIRGDLLKVMLTERELYGSGLLANRDLDDRQNWSAADIEKTIGADLLSAANPETGAAAAAILPLSRRNPPPGDSEKQRKRAQFEAMQVSFFDNEIPDETTTPHDNAKTTRNGGTADQSGARR